MVPARRVLKGLCLLALSSTLGAAHAGTLEPVASNTSIAPGVFFPGGMLGLQIGGSWKRSKLNPAFLDLNCRSNGAGGAFDEVCFFKLSTRVANAEIHAGFMVRKGIMVVLIGTGIPIKNADDALAETVMRDFEAQIHADFQHAGAAVLFVNRPEKPLSEGEFARFSQTAPVLLVELEPREHELAVVYGYLAPVNALSALGAE